MVQIMGLSILLLTLIFKAVESTPALSPVRINRK